MRFLEAHFPLDRRCFLSFYQLQVFSPIIQPLYRRLTYAKIPQTEYAQLLIGIVYPVGSSKPLPEKAKPIPR